MDVIDPEVLKFSCLTAINFAYNLACFKKEDLDYLFIKEEEIIVEDNGRGFAPADDGEKHFALKNIRQRLEIMCSGSLAITPGKDGGTVVTVTIPDNTAQ